MDSDLIWGFGIFENKHSSFFRSWCAAEALGKSFTSFSRGEDRLDMKTQSSFSGEDADGVTFSSEQSAYQNHRKNALRTALSPLKSTFLFFHWNAFHLTLSRLRWHCWWILKINSLYERCAGCPLVE